MTLMSGQVDLCVDSYEATVTSEPCCCGEGDGGYGGVLATDPCILEQKSAGIQVLRSGVLLWTLALAAL